MKFFKRNVGLKSTVYDSSIDALRKLNEDTGAEIVKISPRGYIIANGLDYCSIGLKSKDGSYYSLEAYGNEAIKLREQASLMVLTPIILVS